MRNIKAHKVNIPPLPAKYCWNSLVKRYYLIEDIIPDKPTESFFEKHVHVTGAFMLSLYEFNRIRKSALKEYFETKICKGEFFRLKTRVIFRGPTYYIGYQDTDNKSKLSIIKSSLFEMMSLLDEIDGDDDLILYLSFLDNLKNKLYITLFSLNQLTRERGYRCKSLDVRDYKCFLFMLSRIEDSFVGSLIDKKINLLQDISIYGPLLSSIFEYVFKELTFAEKNSKLKGEIIRKVREVDHPIKMLGFAKKICSQYLPGDCLIVGIEYGGIELPFFVNSYRKRVDTKILNFTTVNMSNYSSNNKICVGNFEEAISPYCPKKVLKKPKHILILDDSTTTGRTIDSFISVLPDSVEEVYLGLLSFKISNRYHHVIRENHGCINPSVLNEAVLGYRAQYSSTYTIKSYTNRNGTFDINKRRIQKLLRVNI